MILTEKQVIARSVRNPDVYDRNTSMWHPDGEVDPILVKDLTDSHLANIINWIVDRDGQYDDEIHSFMVEEAKRRQLTGFASGISYPHCGEDGRYTVVNP